MFAVCFRQVVLLYSSNCKEIFLERPEIVLIGLIGDH